MSTHLFTNIRQLVNTGRGNSSLRGTELALLPCVENAYLLTEDEEIVQYGRMAEINEIPSTTLLTDVKQGTVLPCWCDSHTHLVFAGSRENEFVDKIRGLSYAEINARGGGILNSASRLGAMSEDQLFAESWKKLQDISRMGTGAVEIKSGYGLTVEAELKMLRVIKKLKERSGLFIRSTFLGAHAYPLEYRNDHRKYIDLIIQEMLPVIAGEQLADYLDVFCEQGFFNAAETDEIVRAGLQYGLRPRLHVNQLSSCGGIETGTALDALSLDHLETLTEQEIDLLSNRTVSGNKPWNGICTLLPTAALFLRLPFPPARKLMDAGCALALASDYNPGSSPSGNMNLVVSLSCIQMKMLPEEAINAATHNGACAMEWGHKLGSISVGKKASFIITKPIPSLSYIPYAFGSNLIDKVMIRGQFIS